MKKRTLQKWMPRGLIASLILNVFALGFILSGPVFRGPPPDPSRQLYEAARHLPPESRQRVEAVLDKRTAEIDTAMEDRPEGFKELSRILTAEKVSEEDLKKTFRKMADHHTKISTLLGTMFTELVEALPDPQERITFFKKATPREPPFPRHHKKNRPDRDR